MNIRDNAGIKTRAKAAFTAKWHEHAEPVKLVCHIIKMQIQHGTGDLHTELSKAFTRVGLDVIEAIVDEL